VSYTEDQLWDLVQQAYDIPPGAAQIALAEQIMAHADAQRLTELAMQSRLLATRAYTYGGEPAKAFVTFSWSIAEYDRDPVRYQRSTHTLLWYFKNITSSLLRFPEVPLDRTYAVLDDMERRWREGGHSMHAVYAQRHFVARHVGDTAAAAGWYEQWCTAPRDQLSDCVGCDPSGKVSWLVEQGRDEEAIALAEPVLAGWLTCSEQPHGILTNLLTPYLRTGRLDQARDAHRQAYRLHRPHLADLADISRHLEFAATTGNEARGLEILDRHLGWLDRAPSPWAALRFAASAELLLRRVVATDARARVHRLRHTGRPAAEYPAGDLADELGAQADAIAARFDARNGSDVVSRFVASIRGAKPFVERLPLATAPSRPATPATGVQPPAAVQVEIPDHAGPTELLDLAEFHARRGRDREADAIFAAFDDRYAGADLDLVQRARRADAFGATSAHGGDLAIAETAWTSALELFTRAGDDLRRQLTRGRLGLLYCMTDRAEAGQSMIEEATGYVLAHATPDRWCGSLAALANGYSLVGQPAEALAAIDRAEQYLSACLDPHMPAQLALLRVRCHVITGDWEQVARAAADALRRCQEHGFTEGLGPAHMFAGYAHEQRGDTAGAVAAYDQALSSATDPQLATQVRRQRAGLLAGTERAGEAVDDLLGAVAESRAAGATDAAVAAQHQLAIAYLNSGRPLDCAEHAEEALAWYLEHDPDHAISLRHLLSAAYQRLGQPDEAIAQLDEIRAFCAERTNSAGVGQMAEEIAVILDRLDRDALAATRFAEAAEAFRSADLVIDELRNRRRQATSLLWADQVDAAAAALAVADERSLDLPGQEPAQWERAMLRYDGAKIVAAQGEVATAAVRAAAAADGFRAIGRPVPAAHSESLRAGYLSRLGRYADAEQALRRGLDGLPDDHDARADLADKLAATLEAQGRLAEASVLRAEYGLPDGE
jgi:tetratricopeptide (TPR) repeat protein